MTRPPPPLLYILRETPVGRPRRDGHRSSAGAAAGATDELHRYRRRHHTPGTKRLQAGSQGGTGHTDAPEATAAAASSYVP